MGVHILETEVFKFNFLNFHISETNLYFFAETLVVYVTSNSYNKSVVETKDVTVELCST